VMLSLTAVHTTKFEHRTKRCTIARWRITIILPHACYGALIY
jgi:hypothetical protein